MLAHSEPILSLRLFAVVHTSDLYARNTKRHQFSVVTSGPIAGVVGTFAPSSSPDETVHEALRHDRVVRLAFETYSSVVPFRFGTEFRSRADVLTLLAENTVELLEQLDRFRHRVEMGLKVRLATATAGEPASIRLPAGLGQVQALAEGSHDRCERVRRDRKGLCFEGCYLIPSNAVNRFWEALDALRALDPELPLLGSGPWAAYSFCHQFALREGAKPCP